MKESWRFPEPGSSPHVRGTRGPVHLNAKLRRFIPARAGNTIGANQCCPQSAVHPRTCGEHKPNLIVRDAILRFIPARAGNTIQGYNK
ncbi:hypothetical protein Gbfr_004_059 [Gluconobacter frateurii M-2]|nr:hypothetical protein Gbfr_004_059 [Gluconobacter frateurii M-2]